MPKIWGKMSMRGWLKKPNSKDGAGFGLQRRWSCEIGKKQNNESNPFQSPK